MGFWGDLLGGITKTPKFLRPVLGDSWLDEAGGVGGFLVGGPAGAAAGSGVGTLAANAAQGKGFRPGEALKSGLKAGAVGTGAHLLGVPGAGSINAGGLSSAFNGVNNTVGRWAGALDPRGSGLLAGPGAVTDGAGGGFDIGKAFLLSQGLGTAAQAFGAHQMGRAEDRAYADSRDDLAYQRERDEKFDPIRMRLLDRLMTSSAPTYG